MSDNYVLDFLGCLKQNQSKKQINTDIKQLEKTINMLRLTATLAKGSSKKEINAYIKTLSNQLSTIKLKAKIDSKNLKSEINSALSKVSFKDIDVLNIDGNKTKLKAQKVIADVKAYAEKNPISIGINYENRRNKLDNDLTAYLNRNTKISESSVLLKEADKVRNLIGAINDKKSLREATDAFQLYRSEVSATGFASKSTADRIKAMLSHVTKIGSAFGVATMLLNNFTKSMKTLRENDTVLTEISKTSELTKNQLRELGDEAFKIASKYGQLSSNYLLGVQEMARSGYEDMSKELGELSLLAQSAGDMTADSANNYLLATDAAYKYGGSIEKLNAALDGANYISNKNSATLTDIAEATRVSASFAANASIAINELTAAEATMIAVTKRSGSEIGRAFRSIILNLQQVSGEFDGEVISEEDLAKVEARCHSLGVELEYMKDGIATLRNPIEILKDLAEVYNSLPDNSAEKQGLIADLGGKYHANSLSALLSRWDLYEKMLSEFSQGTGSALEEAEKTANSWEGRLNSLQNSFDSFINTLTNKEAIMGGISFFDRLIQGAETLTNVIGEIPVVLTTLNTAMVAMKKDYGITQLVNKDNGKLDIQGNIFGIDFTNIKNLKKHYEEASIAIKRWNKELKGGKADLEMFDNALVQNNAQLKEYLSTCSEDAPASLNGYKKYLRQTGQATEDLRLKTILLNTALTFLGSIAVQAVITGIATTIGELVKSEENLRQSASDLGSELSNNSSDIEGYKKKIKELKSIINDSSSSFEEVSQARVDLMAIQDELIEKFGTEKGVIENITSAINDQTDALDELSRKSYFQKKNEFNEKTGGDKFADWLSFGNTDDDRIQSNMDKMVSSMRYSFYELQTTGNEVLDNLIAKSYGLNIVDNMYGDGKHFQIYGTLDEIQDKLYGIQELSQDFDLSTGFENSFTTISNDVDDDLAKFKNLYDQYVLYEKILTDNPDNQYDEQFDLINKAKEAYNEAVKSGNKENIKTSADEYAKTLQSAIDLAMGNYDYDVADYFKAMYPELQQMFGEWQFSLNFEPNIDGLQDKVSEALDSIDGVSDGTTSFSVEDIENFNPNVATQEQIDAYGELTNIAETYGLTIKQLITLLQTMGLIQSESYQQLVDTFGQENVDKLSPEDLEIAYIIKNVGNMTFEQLQAEIQKVKDSANETAPLSISETVTQLNTQLKPAMDSLNSAWDEIFENNKFQLNSIDILSTCDSIKSKLDDMSKFGLDVDYSAFENFVSVLNNTESTTDDVDNAFDSLANSIAQAALTGAEDFRTMKAALEDLGVVNSDIIAFQELINNTTALEEAISNAGLTMDDFVVHTEDGSIAATDAAQAFIEEMVGAENCQQALALLQLQHTLCNKDSLNNTDDINACLTLAKAAGVAVESLSWLADVSAQYDAAVAAGDTVAQQNLAATMEAIKKKINDELANFEPTSVDFSGVGKGAKGAGKKAGDAYVDAFEKEYNHLKDMLNRGEISEAQYLNRLRALYTRYFKDRKKYLDEYKKYESEYLSGMLDLHNKALSGISTLLNQKISAANDAKDATVSALQEEKEKAAEVYQSQIDDIEKEKDAIDDLIKEKNKKISSLNEEAEAIRKASEERKRDIELQDAQRRKAQAENQRVELKYSQDKGFYYDVNTEEIRKANEDIAGIQEELQIAELEKQVDLIQKEIDLLEEKKDSLTDEQDRIQKLMDESNKYYDNLIKQQEKMWDSMIRNIEQQKSKWEELANIQEIAEAYSAVQQVFGDLGYTVEDVLNGSDAAFEDFKSRYISLISDVNSNSDFTEGLVYATGVAKENLGSFLDKTKETAEGLDELSGKGSEMDSVAESMDKLSDSATTASTSTGEIASNMGELNTNTQGLSDNLNGIGDALTGIPEADKFDTLATSFTNLGDAIKGVADVLGIGGEGAVSTLVSALQEISKLSLDGAGSGEEGTGSSGKGIISQFNNLKTAVEDVTNAITGGGSSGHMGSDASSSSSPSMSVSAEGEDTSGLINAIEDIKPATDEALVGGEGDGSGAIPQFQELKTAVDDVTAAIGLPDSEGGKGTDSTTLISALRAQYETASETVPETKALFDELLGSITACVNALNSMVSLMSSMPEMGGIGGASVTTHADGTSNNSDATIWTTLADGTRVRDLQPGDKMYDLQQKFNAYLKSIDGNLDKLVPNSVYEHNREMNKLADQISYVSNIVNNNRNLQQPIVNNINVTCPGVTEQQVAERIGSVLDKELDKQFSGFHNYVDQRSRMR